MSDLHPRVRDVLRVLDEHREVLRAAVEAIPHPLRTVRPAADRWSVAEVLEHLAIVERSIARLISNSIAEGRASGLGVEDDDAPVAGSVDMHAMLDRSRPMTAPDRAVPRGHLNADEAWALLETAGQAVRDAVSAGSGLALGAISHRHPLLGSLNLYQWVVFVGAHETRHSAQIREIGAALDARPQ